MPTLTTGQRLTARILLPLLLLEGCSTYRLVDHPPSYALERQARATAGHCAVAPFLYTPSDPDDADLMSADDLARWNQRFTEVVIRSNLCARTQGLSRADERPASIDYLIEGEIRSFYFKKNWVPMFFPVWMGLTVFTLGLYGLAAGPMNTTRVDFAFTVRLREARTGRVIATLPENFQSTDVMTLYSDTNENPYHNPGLAFAATINPFLRRLGEAIAGKSASQPVSTAGG